MQTNQWQSCILSIEGFTSVGGGNSGQEQLTAEARQQQEPPTTTTTGKYREVLGVSDRSQ